MMVTARDSESPVAQQRPQKPFRSSVSCSPARPRSMSQPVMASMSGSFMIGGHVLAMHG